MAFRSLNCSVDLEFQPDPDIAGIGIVTGFLSTAWLVILILIVYYVFYYDPATDPFSDDTTTKLPRPNPFDMVFYNVKTDLFDLLIKGLDKVSLSDLLKKMRTRAGSQVFQETVLAFSDAQIVTGLAIMSSGYYAVTQGLSGYHWRMVTRIAWFSTITHLAALSCLRTYLYNNPVKRGFRLFLMGSLSFMVIAGTMAQADIRFQNNRPAICFFRVPGPELDSTDPEVVFSVLLLIYNIILRVLKLHKWTAEKTLKLFNRIAIALLKPLARLLVYMLEKIPAERLQLLFYMVVVQPYVASLMLAETYFLMYTSAVSEVYWLLVTAGYGTFSLFYLRDVHYQGENTWTFGQVVACAMLIAPLLVFVDSIEKTWKSGDPAPSPEERPSRRNDRYTDWAGQLGGPADLIARLRRIEAESYSSLSIGPLVTFDIETDSGRPLLHHFEDLLFFKFLVAQLCLWALFATFWVVFAGFPQFRTLVFEFMPAVWFQDAPWPIYSDQFPATSAVYMLFWILFLGPSSSVFFVLFWRWSPRTSYEPHGAWRLVTFALRFLFTVSFLLLPTLTFICYLIDEAARIFGYVLISYGLFCVGKSVFYTPGAER